MPRCSLLCCGTCDALCCMKPIRPYHAVLSRGYLTRESFLQVLNLESKCADLQVNITALREEISERESVIAQNYTTIQLLRRRLADMEKHKFVLGYRTQVILISSGLPGKFSLAASTTITSNLCPHSSMHCCASLFAPSCHTSWDST